MSAAAIRHALSCGKPRCTCRFGSNTHCPAPGHRHGDEKPSLTVHESTDGKPLVNCKAGCDQQTVIGILKDRGLWDTAPIPISRPKPAKSGEKREPVAIYQYRDAAGVLVAEKARFETPAADGGKPDKDFRWRLPGSTAWNGGIALKDTPLFGADLVAKADPSEPVFFVEGEAAAQACQTAGLIAVTFGGGASSTEFGGSLQILADRDVRLWPDNDAVGKKYMSRIHAALASIARRVVILPIQTAGEKDDAVEYFTSGGTTAAILAIVPPDGPVVRRNGDEVTVDLETGNGQVRYAFADLVQSTHEITCELTVAMTYGIQREPFSARLNILSQSSVAEFRRTLDGYFETDKAFWVVPTARAIALVRQAVQDYDPSVHVSELAGSGSPTYLVDTLLPEHVPTMWFGDGSSGKSWVAIRAALAIGLSGELAGRQAKRGGVLYVDWETDSATFNGRLLRIGEGLGYSREAIDRANIFYWPSDGTSFADMIPALKRKVAKDRIDLVIVDSVSAACGGPPEDANVAQRFMNSGRKLDATLLLIGHIAKGSDTMKAFGSTMWHNFCRRTFFVARQQEEESSSMSLAMYCRKANDGRLPRPIGLDVTFEDPDGAVTFRPGDITQHSQLAEGLNPWTRIRGFLAQGTATAQEISDVLGIPLPTVKKELGSHRSDLRNVNPGTGRGHEGLYGLASDDFQAQFDPGSL